MIRKARILLYTLIIGLLNAISISCEKDDPKEIAILSTAEVTKTTQTTAISGGNISYDGGALVTTRGVCWSKSKTPTINDAKTTDGKGKSSFTSNITNLAPNTTYYVRAYAINSAGRSYGNTITFKTLEELEMPTLTTAEASKITHTSAVTGGTITYEDDAEITVRGVCWSKSETPTINDSKTEDGKGAGSFTSDIVNLEQNTTYYVRAYASNNEGVSYGSTIAFTTMKVSENAIDADGNVYKIATIGTQTWMTENLKTTKYNDGTNIPLVTDGKTWATGTPGYCCYNNNEITFGALYNWHAVNTGKLCPEGWHVPTDLEWTKLVTFLGGDPVAGGKLKETGTSHWQSPNKGATNETDFTALLGGFRESDGTFRNINFSTHWWSTTEHSSTKAYIRDIFFVEAIISRYESNKNWGCSVRCIKD